MRIAFVTETWLPATDGIVTRLSATLRELGRAGHELLVIAPDGERAEFPGVTVRSVPALGLPFIYGGQRWGLPTSAVDRYLRDFGPDVVHLVNPLLLGLAGYRSVMRRRLPVVVSYHTDVAAYASRYHLSWTSPIQWSILRRIHWRADRSLATSERSIAQLGRHGIRNVDLWPRGVDLEHFHPGVPPRPRTKRTALYVGRLAREKDVQRLAPLLTDRSTELKIVGDGPARSHLEQHLPGARFTGLLHGDDLADAYRSAEVFVFPSTTDTLGLVLLEALASGLPVVAADSAASRETLSDCHSARLFPADQPDQLPRIVDELLNSAARPELSRAARKLAEQASWQQAAESLINHYRQVVDEPSAARAPSDAMAHVA